MDWRRGKQKAATTLSLVAGGRRWTHDEQLGAARKRADLRAGPPVKSLTSGRLEPRLCNPEIRTFLRQNQQLRECRALTAAARAASKEQEQ